VTAASRYEALSQGRSSYLERGRQCAKLTLPALLPEDDSGGKHEGVSFKTPFQGVGARGVSNLAARCLMTLFPPNMPMFRMQTDDLVLQEAQEAARATEGDPQGKAWKTELETALSRYEMAVQTHLESSGDRPVIHETLLHLFTTGNALFKDGLTPEEGSRFFPLNRYVISRDPMGRWVELVVKEDVSLEALDDSTRSKVMAALEMRAEDDDAEGDSRNDPDKLVEIFTHVRRVGQNHEAYQECNGRPIEGTEAVYPPDACPFIPLRLYWVAGEDYGRSYVENVLGDLKSLEALTRAIVEGSAASAKGVFLVRPNGVTKAVDVQRAPNWGFVTGSPEDIAPLQVQKHADLRVALETIGRLENRLAQSFMLLDGMRRDAERVTAEEIRALAESLENYLGGIYSMLSQEFQMPYIKRKIHKLTKGRKLPTLPKNTAAPTIITGFEALGRGNDKSKLTEYLGTLANILGPETLLAILNPSEAAVRLAAADGINTKGLIKTQEELQAEQEQAQAQQQQQQAMEALGPGLMDGLGQMMKQGGGGGMPGAMPGGMPGGMPQQAPMPPM
jgi:hypothetical protein